MTADPFAKNVARKGATDPVFRGPLVVDRPPDTSPLYAGPRRNDSTYLAWKRIQECLAVDCGSRCNWMGMDHVDPHHDPTVGSGRKDDRKTGSLCRGHHVEIGTRGRLGDWCRWRTKYEVAKDQIDGVCDYQDGG